MGAFLANFTSFQAAFHWVLLQGYWVIFLGMLIEGPIITSAAAFAVSMGYFNLFAIFVLAVLGDLVADVFYYLIGYWGRITVVEWFAKWAHISNERLERIGKLVHEHPWRALFALKMTPIIPTTGLMVVGTTKMPIRKYAFICTVIILPRAIFFMVIGYYFGKAYDQVSKYITNITYVVIGVVALLFLINYLFNKYTAKVARKVEKI